MTPERWQRVNNIFLEIVSGPADQRDALLQAHCGGDTELRNDVEELLAHDASGIGFYTQPIPPGGLFVDTSYCDQFIGRQLGRYVIRELIGQGGMGAVYRGERASDYEQQVAIKVLHQTAASPESFKRFQAEVQYLAAMGEHPNIAALLDAGRADDGVPYFVMELVAGERIDRYCDGQRLNTRKRLELFRTVCAAVHFAHQHTVIHRDLKPSNILVRTDGTPKLIDFGIAKLTTWVGEKHDDTRTGFRALTPEYASPEQLLGKPVTTASDVYSLGVVLYELLTGHRPFRVGGMDLITMAKSVTERAPERPSTAVELTQVVQSNDGERSTISPDAISKSRDATLQKLRRLLSGDVDNIVLMALRREPERRYASVDQLSADIERHLNGHPVIARPDTLTYRMGKFLMRNWAGVAASAAILLLLVGGIIGTTWQWLRADRLAVQAHNEAATAKAVNDFFVLDMISKANPTRRPGNISLNEVLEQAAARIDKRFANSPELEAIIRTTLGDALLHLGNFQAAETQLREAAALREKLFGANARLTLTAMALRADALDCLEHFDEAEQLQRMVCERMATSLGPDDPDTLQAQANLGETLQTQGKHDEAQALLLSVVDRQRRVLPDDDSRRGSAFNSLGASYQAQKKYAEAEKAFREYVAINDRAPNADKTKLLTGLNQLASLYYAQGQFEKAKPLFRQLLEVAPNILPPDNPQLALYHGNYGICLTKLNRFAEAEPHVLKAYEVNRKALGDDHSQTESNLINVYGYYYHSGQPDKAEPYHIRQIETRLRLGKCNDDDAHRLAISVARFVKPNTERGRQETIQQLYETLEHYVEKELQAGSLRQAAALANLGVVLGDAGQCETGERLLRKGFDMYPMNAADDEGRKWISRRLVELKDKGKKSGKPL